MCDVKTHWQVALPCKGGDSNLPGHEQASPSFILFPTWAEDPSDGHRAEGSSGQADALSRSYLASGAEQKTLQLLKGQQQFWLCGYCQSS